MSLSANIIYSVVIKSPIWIHEWVRRQERDTQTGLKAGAYLWVILGLEGGDRELFIIYIHFTQISSDVF